MSAGRFYPAEQVQRGIERFLADMRQHVGLDAEPEIADLCASCGQYPAAYQDRCFGCHAKGGLPA